MYNSYFEWFWNFHKQSWMTGITLYSQLLENTVQLYTAEILAWETPKEPDNKVFTFHKRNTPSHSENHQVTFYNFPGRQTISQIEWSRNMKDEYRKYQHELTLQFSQDTGKIHESFMNYRNQFLRFIYQFISHLMNPLFQRDHYEQFKTKHIWIQGKEDNIIYAFAFPPEEMNLYTEIDSLRITWEEIRENLITWLSDVIRYLEEIHPTFDRIRLFDPAIESIYWEEWVKDMLLGVSGFMNKIELFDPESYFLFEKELLEETQKWLEEALAQ